MVDSASSVLRLGVSHCVMCTSSKVFHSNMILRTTAISMLTRQDHTCVERFRCTGPATWSTCPISPMAPCSASSSAASHSTISSGCKWYPLASCTRYLSAVFVLLQLHLAQREAARLGALRKVSHPYGCRALLKVREAHRDTPTLRLPEAKSGIHLPASNTNRGIVSRTSVIAT